MTEKRLYYVKPRVIQDVEELVEDVYEWKMDKRTKSVQLDERQLPVITATGEKMVRSCPSISYEYPVLPSKAKKTVIHQKENDQVWLVEAHPAIQDILVKDDRCRHLTWMEAKVAIKPFELLEVVMPDEVVEPVRIAGEEVERQDAR